MNSAELEQYKATLERMLARMETPLQRRDEIAIENTADTIDETGNAAHRELVMCQLELVSKRHSELKGALRRIHDGTYGVCLECESDIGMKRLNAVPWAQYCISCQEAAEHNGSRSAPEWKSSAAFCR